MQFDKMEVGLQMTHSLDSFITDSANSATAIMTGHKSTVNALGVYVDSSPDAFDDPKIETIAERESPRRAGRSWRISDGFYMFQCDLQSSIGKGVERSESSRPLSSSMPRPSPS